MKLNIPPRGNSLSTPPTPIARRAVFASFAAAAGLLSGCASVLTPLGDNHYDCNRKENPQSPYCHSFKAVEESTAGAIPRSRYDETLRLSDLDRLTGIAPSSAVASAPTESQSGAPRRQRSPGAAGIGHGGAPMSSGSLPEGIPVRLGPVVQRVWVKRFVDANDLLVGETVIYKEIMPSRWSGFEAVDPLRVDARAASFPAGIYPHRPPSIAGSAMKALDGTSPPSSYVPLSPRSASTAPASPEFIQPGAKAPGSAELVTVPATTSGTTSMPQ